MQHYETKTNQYWRLRFVENWSIVLGVKGCYFGWNLLYARLCRYVGTLPHLRKGFPMVNNFPLYLVGENVEEMDELHVHRSASAAVRCYTLWLNWTLVHRRYWNVSGFVKEWPHGWCGRLSLSRHPRLVFLYEGPCIEHSDKQKWAPPTGGKVGVNILPVERIVTSLVSDSIARTCGSGDFLDNVIEISVSKDRGANVKFKTAWLPALGELSLVESFHQNRRRKPWTKSR